jgi:glycerol-3-phosphate acyltransferase PlsX
VENGVEEQSDGAAENAITTDADETPKRRVALDAMGGDNAPSEIVLGAIQAAQEQGIGVWLVGPEETLRAELARHDTTGLDLEIVHTDEVIGMDEHPAEAVRSRRRITGVDRPALGAVLPAADGARTLVLDVGANTDSKPEYLAQFALMGSAYMRSAFGVERPRVGLLANGEEETKGDQLVQEAHQLLKATASAAGLNFIGNIEGRDINAGTVDVVVCDGFVGNVVLKLSEGISKMILATIRKELMAGPISAAGGMLAKPAFNRVRKQMDYEEYGGAPLLGVNGVSIISHGRSGAKAIKNAIRVAVQAADAHMPEMIAKGLQSMSQGASQETSAPVTAASAGEADGEDTASAS